MYCQHGCWAEHRRKINTFTCVQCGGFFYRPPAHAARATVALLCSHKCHGEYQRGENNRAWKPKVKKNCVACGTEFECEPGQVRRLKTCSPKCRSANLRVVKLKAPREKACAYCGKTFRRGYWKQQTCSAECKAAQHADRIRGKGNGRYVHGQHQQGYGPGWTKSMKEQIRTRDGDCCRMCGMTAEAHGKLLCVHHIDYDKDNMGSHNLLTVCRWCHGKLHGSLTEREKWKRELSALLDTYLLQIGSLISG